MFCTRLTDRLDPEQTGAKAADLARARAAGLSVPEGFVVTRGALALFLDAANLTRAVSEYLAGTAERTRCQDRERFGALSSQVMAAPVPAQLSGAV